MTRIRPGRAPSVKWAAALTAVLMIALVSFSRLYLGAHWMSDVLGSPTLGTAWIALLSFSYLQHARNEHVPALSLAGVAMGTMLLAGGAAVATQYPADVARYTPQPAAAPVLLADWETTGWRRLPARRTEVDGDHEGLVLRLWRSGRAIEAVGETPSMLWLGMVTVARIQHPASAFTLVLTDPDFHTALAKFVASLQTQDPSLGLVRRDTWTVLLLR